MQRFAAFDIGTNTVLMAVADRTEDGRWVPVLDRGEVTRLGEGVDHTGLLSPEAIQRTVSVLSRFAEEARSLGAERMLAAATSASRDARNGHELVEAARQLANVEVEIISGQQEAEWVFRAVQEDFGEPGRSLVAVDIGGGSTEVIYGEHAGAPAFRTSLQIGSVRLTERHVRANPIPLENRAALRQQIRAALAQLPPMPAEAELVAVAETATSLAAIARGRASVSDPAIQGAELKREELGPLVEHLADLDLEARRQVHGLSPKRADVICAGGYILFELMERFGLERCRVSDRGVRWGLLIDRFGGS